MFDCKLKVVLCELGVNKVSVVNESEFENVKLYCEIVGSLIYFMICIRFDLCYVVMYLF